jgi:microcystin-dependent protein
MRFPDAMTTPQDILARAWPVGSVFVSAVDTNPADLMGFGTWQAFGAGRVLVGLDAGQTEFDALGETGGAKAVTLTEQQMPAHTHVQDAHNHTQNSHNHTQDPHSHVETVNTAATGPNVGAAPDASTNTGVASGYSTQPTTATNQAATATNQAATAVNQSTGGGQAHENMPPYITVRFWKRIG